MCAKPEKNERRKRHTQHLCVRIWRKTVKERNTHHSCVRSQRKINGGRDTLSTHVCEAREKYKEIETHLKGQAAPLREKSPAMSTLGMFAYSTSSWLRQTSHKCWVRFFLFFSLVLHDFEKDKEVELMKPNLDFSWALHTQVLSVSLFSCLFSSFAHASAVCLVLLVFSPALHTWVLTVSRPLAFF
jgi:hypothetical protein